MYRRMRFLVSAIVLVVLWGALGHTRHGELPNRTWKAISISSFLGPGCTPPGEAIGIPVFRWAAAVPQRERRRP